MGVLINTLYHIVNTEKGSLSKKEETNCQKTTELKLINTTVWNRWQLKSRPGCFCLDKVDSQNCSHGNHTGGLEGLKHLLERCPSSYTLSIFMRHGS